MENEQKESFLRVMIRSLITAIAAFLVLIGIITKVIAFQKFPWYIAAGGMSFYILMFVLFIIRHNTKEASSNPLHWFFAICGTCLPLAIVTHPQHPALLTWVSFPFEVTGMCLSLIAIYTLGRSFGIIAANRKIKTSGVYGFIRHPLYAGETLWVFAIILQNLSPFNLFLFIVQNFCQVKRMLEEEAILQKDETYADYMQKVRWRMIPGIF